jgi:hypothetical protein
MKADHDARVVSELNKKKLGVHEYFDHLDRAKFDKKFTLVLRDPTITGDLIARLWLLVESGFLFSLVLHDAKMSTDTYHWLEELGGVCRSMNVDLAATGADTPKAVLAADCFDRIDHVVTENADIVIGSCRSIRIEIASKVRGVIYVNRLDPDSSKGIIGKYVYSPRLTRLSFGQFESLEIVMDAHTEADTFLFMASLARVSNGVLPLVTVTFVQGGVAPVIERGLADRRVRRARRDPALCDQLGVCISAIDDRAKYFRENGLSCPDTDFVLLSVQPPPPPIFRRSFLHGDVDRVAVPLADALLTNNPSFVASTLYRLISNTANADKYETEISQLRAWLTARFQIDIEVTKAAVRLCIQSDLRLVYSHSDDEISLLVCDFMGFGIEPQEVYSNWLVRYAPPHPGGNIGLLPLLPFVGSVANSNVKRKAATKPSSREDKEEKSMYPIRRSEGKEAAILIEDTDIDESQPELSHGDGEFDLKYPNSLEYEDWRHRKAKRKRQHK